MGMENCYGRLLYTIFCSKEKNCDEEAELSGRNGSPWFQIASNHGMKIDLTLFCPILSYRGSRYDVNICNISIDR
jgi:hypothetical protein